MTPAAVSVQLYSIRDAMDEDLASAIHRIAEIGFTNVELFDIVNLQAGYRTALADNGLTALSAHAPLLTEADPEAYLDAAAALGASIVIEPLVPQETWTSLDDVKRIADGLNALVEPAARRGLKVGYHNHGWEFRTRFDGVSAYERFATMVAPEVRLELDTYWATVGGDDASAVLSRLGDQVGYLHIKDGPTTPEYFDGYIDADLARAQRPAGGGSMEFEPIFAAAPHAVRVIEFDNYAGDVFDGLSEALAYVNLTDKES